LHIARALNLVISDFVDTITIYSLQLFAPIYYNINYFLGKYTAFYN